MRFFCAIDAGSVLCAFLRSRLRFCSLCYSALWTLIIFFALSCAWNSGSVLCASLHIRTTVLSSALFCARDYHSVLCAFLRFELLAVLQGSQAISLVNVIDSHL
jgi:hypothetical protein